MTSAFAQGFQMGSEMYDSSERMKLAKAAEDRASKEFSWREKEQQGKEGLRQAALEMEQTGDTVPVQSGVGATGGIDEGGFTLQQQPITQEQKVANFRRRALELGASPEAIQQHELSGYQVAAARRSNDIDNRFDKTMNSLHEDSAKRLNDIQTTAEQEGMNGLYKKFSPELKKAYPGMDIQQVGNSIVLTHGKQKQVINNLSEAVSALKIACCPKACSATLLS
jgi:hypothetical protein